MQRWQLHTITEIYSDSGGTPRNTQRHDCFNSCTRANPTINKKSSIIPTICSIAWMVLNCNCHLAWILTIKLLFTISANYFDLKNHWNENNLEDCVDFNHQDLEQSPVKSRIFIESGADGLGIFAVALCERIFSSILLVYDILLKRFNLTRILLGMKLITWYSVVVSLNQAKICL